MRLPAAFFFCIPSARRECYGREMRFMDYFTSFFAAITLRRLLKNKYGSAKEGAPAEKTDKDKEDFPP
jgi:hypothetical protein